MGTILVTGASGTLGRALLDRFRETGRSVRALSRQARPSAEWVAGDLATGDGIALALTGVDTIVHCATTLGNGDIAATRRLIDLAAPGTHLVYISIVGIDRVPFGYYRAKLAVERDIEESSLPWTILRATQFHDLIRRVFDGQRRLPVLAVPAFSFQPVDVREVAGRLADLAVAPPAGHVPDMGGPQIRSASDLARAYLRATGRHRAILPVRLPGATFRAYREGGHLAPDHAVGKITFDRYLAGV